MAASSASPDGGPALREAVFRGAALRGVRWGVARDETGGARFDVSSIGLSVLTGGRIAAALRLDGDRQQADRQRQAGGAR